MPSDSCKKYEELILAYWEERESDSVSRVYWDEGGEPRLELALLERLLSKSAADCDTVRSGGLAKALDMWIAEELRAAGFDSEAVWPRLHAPRVLDPSVLRFVGTLNATAAEACCKALPRYVSSNANVLGSAYRKQVDVGLSSWMTGPEILISTKTMGSSFGKNLANRFEEAYGDAKNLKGRHPLATLGFFFLVNADIVDEANSYAKAISMLEKLQMEVDAYDVVCLMLADFGQLGSVRISESNKLVPKHLSAGHFFSEVVSLTLLRASLDSHELARTKMLGDVQ